MKREGDCIRDPPQCWGLETRETKNASIPQTVRVHPTRVYDPFDARAGSIRAAQEDAPAGACARGRAAHQERIMLAGLARGEHTDEQRARCERKSSMRPWFARASSAENLFSCPSPAGRSRAPARPRSTRLKTLTRSALAPRQKESRGTSEVRRVRRHEGARQVRGRLLVRAHRKGSRRVAYSPRGI